MTVNASSLIRISVDSSGTSANNVATGGVMSADGRYVVFQSPATNLVSGDVNGFFDVFLRDTQTGTTTLLSTATGGTQGNNVSSVAAITNDGRFVFFNSNANNLVGGDTNAGLDVFMRDTLTGVTTRVSTASDGSQADGASQNVDVTGDGAFIGFQSTATNLVAGDTNGFSDVFVKNLSSGVVNRISVANDGSQANGTSLVARLSDDGNRVSFVSTASNLTANDSNGAVTDVFVRDIAAGTTTLVSASTTGGSGDAQSSGASISGNGRYVVFQSDATNLVAGDTNGATDIFVRDLLTNTTTRASTATDGSQSNELSGQAVISADGRYVVFFSLASNLVQGDTNGLRDIFLKDMVTGNVTRLSVAVDGSELNDLSNTPSISADGRYVTFQTQATNTGVGAEGNGTGFDVFRISLMASAVADRMIGSDGNDTIDGLAGDDILTGGFGNDVLIGGAGADQLLGGAGIDTADYSASAAGVTIDLGLGTASGGDAAGDTLIGIENVTGSASADDLTGAAGVNILAGGAGNDVLAGLDGADTLDGGLGTDTADYTASTAGVIISLQAGTATGGHAQGDTLTGIENLTGSAFTDALTGTDGGANVLDGGDGNDVLIGLGGADALIGGTGTDTANYIASTAGIIISLEAGTAAGGHAEGDTLIGIENVTGSASADDLTGAAGVNILSGGAGNDVLAGLDGADTLDGGGGSDTADYTASTAGIIISLQAGTAAGGHAEGDTLTSIENLTGSAFDDTLTGAADANRLTGGAGGDILAGLGGADTLDGGAGVDTADYSASAAGVTIDLGLGTASGGDAAGDTLTGIENLTGSSFGDTLTGTNGGANSLSGGAGNDVLAGLGGADTLDGGGGSDTADYTASTAGIIISLQAGTAAGGHAEGDTLTGIENLTGSSFDDTLTGTDADANTLAGGAGNDILDGLGGGDTLTGGAGNDIYYVDAAGDQTVELANEGMDLVRASLDWILADNVEWLELQGTAALSGTGNALDNIILGNSGDNLLVGGAGDDLLNGVAGADTAAGGTGNDRYHVDDAGDIIVENAAEGTADRVYASVSYQLAAGAEVEVLNTRTPAATTGIDLTGNEFGQTIIGNAGANIIDGRGGIDTMKGLGGNDVYHVDNSGDIVIERSPEGTADQVMTSVDYTLGHGVGIEILSAADAAGTAAIQLTGNSYANTITGNAGDNVINGGRGQDTLTGLGGSDTFVFNAALIAQNVDHITDFNAGDDIIQLDHAIFTALTALGTLAASAFVANTSGYAESADNRLIYETDTGKLIYDSNGSAAGERHLFATLDTNLAITAADFFVV